MSVAFKQSRRTAPTVPFNMVLLSAAGLWVCYFVILTLRAYTLESEFQFEVLWRRAIVSVVGFGFVLILWQILRLFERRAAWMRYVVALIVCVPLAVAITLANAQIFEAMEKRIEAEKGLDAMLRIRRDESGNLFIEMPEEVEEEAQAQIEAVAVSRPGTVIVRKPSTERKDGIWVWVSEMAFGRYFMLLAWCALYFALLAGEKARGAERREGEFRRAAKLAELRSLRYQVNPHFLFNTLNSLSALVMTERGEEAERMIQSLSTFYRRSLSSDPTADVTLADEVELQRLYLGIESVRFPSRLKVAVDLPETLIDAMVPGMILQPLVENSVKYAVAASAEPVTIKIGARAEGTMLFVSVEDDGPGTETGDPHGVGIGLGNVRERLEARFGDAAKLEFGPREEGGFRTTIRLPLEHGNG